MQPALVISMPRDGHPVWVDFFSQTVGEQGQLELSAVKPAKGQKGTFWYFKLAVPTGGLVEHDDEFPFYPPATGYAPIVEYKFMEGDEHWTQNLHKRFYIKFDQPAKYGEIDVQTSMYMGVILKFSINPTGDRNLEPKGN